MLCHICRTNKAAGPQSYFGHHYIPVCDACHAKVQASKSHPYSKVMDAAALAEAGYYLNRKRARR